MKHALILILSVFLSTGWSQNTAELYFKSGTVSLEPNRSSWSSELTFNEKELQNGFAYRLIHFNSIPNLEERTKLSESGIVLLNYLPRNTYYANISVSIDFSKMEPAISGIYPILKDYKLSPNLTFGSIPDYAIKDNGYLINATYFDKALNESLHNQILNSGIEIIEQNTYNYLTLWVPENKLEVLYSFPEFYYFDAVTPPGEPENLPGRTNHRSNYLASESASGLQFDASGVTIMMQDDGYIGEHIDYKGRIDQSNCSNCSTDPNNDHGDHVAGTIMGAGNIDPDTRGMAHGAQLLVYNSSNSNYNSVPGLYTGNDLVITSKSYSAGCNGGYDNLASQLDQQTRELNSLLHVFSAGNSGQSDCGYGPLGWGNITGGHKSGKNVIAVGNLNTYDVINNSSSRGPATDGRIKPDICGVGTAVYSTEPGNLYGTKTGTSMSCPGVAGTIAQLYHAYKAMNGGQNPTSGLIKASLLNSADDLGNPGPDFVYGWGRINARAAYETLMAQQYIRDTIVQNENESFFINVPPSTKQIKIMVYWTDYEGSTSSSVSLVNDINMIVTDPSMTTYNPWVLDPTPTISSLSADAVPGVDNLNNMEQVSIDNPVSGMYEVNIDGFAIPQGPQEYFIVYQLINDEITVTYPNGGEGFNSPSTETIRWDANDGIEDFTIEFSTDSGTTWNSIGTAASTDRYYNWAVPNNVISGQAKIRVSRGAISDDSDSLFSIIRTPYNLAIEWACPDSLKFTWDSIPNVAGYEVSMLGNMYMDSVGFSTLQSIVLPVSSTDTTWLSVRSLGTDGARGRRAIALQKLPGQFGCLWSDPIANFEVNCDTQAENACFDVINTSVNVDGSAIYTWYFPGGNPSTSTLATPNVCYSSTGYHDAALVVNNGAGTDSIYLSDYIYITPAQNITYYESFEGYSTLGSTENWDTFNDAGAAFVLTTSTGLSGSNCALLTNFGQASGRTDQLISGPVDLSVVDALAGETVTLSFRYSYRKRNENNHEYLRLKVKNTCDGNWVTRKTLQGQFLSDIISTTFWTPTDTNDWVTVHVTNITETYFVNDFQFMFEFISDGGNNLYIDDINIYKGAPSDDIIVGLNEVEQSPEVTVFPNPGADLVELLVNALVTEELKIELTDLQGKIVHSFASNIVSGDNIILLDTSVLESGTYLVHISGVSMNTVERLQIIH